MSRVACGGRTTSAGAYPAPKVSFVPREAGWGTGPKAVCRSPLRRGRGGNYSPCRRDASSASRRAATLFFPREEGEATDGRSRAWSARPPREAMLLDEVAARVLYRHHGTIAGRLR